MGLGRELVYKWEIYLYPYQEEIQNEWTVTGVAVQLQYGAYLYPKEGSWMEMAW